MLPQFIAFFCNNKFGETSGALPHRKYLQSLSIIGKWFEHLFSAHKQQMQAAHFNANFLRRAIIRLALMLVNNVVVGICLTQTDQYKSIGTLQPDTTPAKTINQSKLRSSSCTCFNTKFDKCSSLFVTCTRFIYYFF